MIINHNLIMVMIHIEIKLGEIAQGALISITNIRVYPYTIFLIGF